MSLHPATVRNIAESAQPATSPTTSPPTGSTAPSPADNPGTAGGHLAHLSANLCGLDSDTGLSMDSGLSRACLAASTRSWRLRPAVACGSAASRRAWISAAVCCGARAPREQVAALASRAAAHAPLDAAGAVAELLAELREAGTHDQAAALAGRLPSAGLFTVFSGQQAARISSVSGGRPMAARVRHGAGKTWTYGLLRPLWSRGSRVQHLLGCPLGDRQPNTPTYRPVGRTACGNAVSYDQSAQ